MKKFLSFPMLIMIGVTLITTSCKKDDAARNNTGSGNLDAGKSAISLNASPAFAGGGSFSLSNTVTNTAQTLSSSSLRNVSLSATEISGTNTRTVMITIITPVDASTTSGNLTGDLSLPNGATILPTVTLSSTNGSSPGITYGSTTGTLTITKLTATEVEGSFSGEVKDVNGSATLTISNGSFAGKF